MKAPRFRFNNNSLQKAFDKIADHLDKIPKHKKIIAGENLRKQESVDEVILHGTPAGGKGGAGAPDCNCPWDVKFEAEEDSDPTTYKAVMTYGRVNNSVTDETELKTGIDPTAKNPSPQYVCLEVTFGTTGGIETWSISEEGSIPDAPAPEQSYPTSAKIVIGVRKGMTFHRIVGCHNLVIYPIRIGGDDSAYWSYEVMAS
mgnify:CR=1 FL=1